MPDEMPIESDGASLRCRRVAEAIKQIVGQMVVQELSDPRTGFVTVTRVKVSPDLCQARVFVTVLGEGSDRSKAMGALRHAAGYIRRRCGDELKLRFTPHLAFEFDTGVDKSIRVSELLFAAGEESAADRLPPLEGEPSGTGDDRAAGGPADGDPGAEPAD